MGRHRLLTQLLILALAGLSLLLAAGFFGGHHPALDSFSHFRNHFAVLAALLALILLLVYWRSWPMTLPALSLAVFALSSTGALGALHFRPAKAGFEAAPTDMPIYRLLQMNLRYDNSTPEKVLSLIGRVKPDVITLNEVSSMWKEKLSLLAASYPYRIICAVSGRKFNVGIMSRRPFAEGTEPRCYNRGVMAIARVDFGGSAIDVAALHLTWPWPFDQNRQIGKLQAPLASLGPNVIMGGDFNAAPWSAAVRAIAAGGGLTVMPSVGPTWLHRDLPDFLYFAGLPIDQVLSRGGVRIHSAKRMEDTGSDHLPILVEFSIQPETGKQDEEATSLAALN